MGDKSRPVLLMIGGGYLIYTGSRLISEVMESHPTSENLFIAFGAFFVIFGVLIVGANLKKIYDLNKSEKESDVVVEDIEFPEAIEEPPVQQARTAKKQIKMVNLEASEEKSETTDNEGADKTAIEESQENTAENETSEEETAENEIFDVDDSDDEFIETDDDEFYDEEEEADDEYEDDEYEDDDEYDDEGQEETDEEDAEAESDEDLFKIKLERI